VTVGFCTTIATGREDKRGPGPWFFEPDGKALTDDGKNLRKQLVDFGKRRVGKRLLTEAEEAADDALMTTERQLAIRPGGIDNPRAYAFTVFRNGLFRQIPRERTVPLGPGESQIRDAVDVEEAALRNVELKRLPDLLSGFFGRRPDRSVVVQLRESECAGRVPLRAAHGLVGEEGARAGQEYREAIVAVAAQLVEMLLGRNAAAARAIRDDGTNETLNELLAEEYPGYFADPLIGDALHDQRNARGRRDVLLFLHCVVSKVRNSAPPQTTADDNG